VTSLLRPFEQGLLSVAAVLCGVVGTLAKLAVEDA
jgi:hypothetical protein